MDAPTGERVGGVRTLEGAFDDYIRELRTAFALDLSGMRVALDCANGATYRAAPVIFGALGAELELIGVEPDGRNINADRGSTHPEALIELVRWSGARHRIRVRRRRRPGARGRWRRPSPRRR